MIHRIVISHFFAFVCLKTATIWRPRQADAKEFVRSVTTSSMRDIYINQCSNGEDGLREAPSNLAG